MAQKTTYSAARANLARLCDKAVDDREVIIINRGVAAVDNDYFAIVNGLVA